MQQCDKDFYAKEQISNRQDFSRTVCSENELPAVREPRLSYSVVQKNFKHGKKKSFLGFSTMLSNKFEDLESERRHKEAVQTALKNRLFSAKGSTIILDQHGKNDTYYVKVLSKTVSFQFNEEIFRLEEPSTYDFN